MVFRELTTSDYYYINRLPDSEEGGGGQSYIDIPTSSVTLDDWRSFFEGVSEVSPQPAGGPKWRFEVFSLGPNKGPQVISIGQRRPATVSIRSQKLHSRQSHRLYAWHPDYTGFPKPDNPEVQTEISDLRIYIVKLENNQYWAGWIHTGNPETRWETNDEIELLFNRSEGFIEFEKEVYFDKNDSEWPFRVVSPEQETLFDFDESPDENDGNETETRMKEFRVRNTKAVSKLKDLYNNHCQISGTEKTFQKKNGEWYSEAHHLIPLGEGGSDNEYNIIIVSPLIHRMLHYADVEGIDLNRIQNNQLDITINGEDYTIKWKPQHADLVDNSL